MKCDRCGSTEFVTVSGKAALALFPSGRRCAYYFAHGLMVRPGYWSMRLVKR